MGRTERSHKARVERIGFNGEALTDFLARLDQPDSPPNLRRHLREYPTVYVVEDHQTRTAGAKTFDVYVGETSDIRARTEQHLGPDAKSEGVWKMMKSSETSGMYVIGHPYFNKSLTLDVENRLMQYLSSVDAVQKIHNRRTNPQNDYYTRERFEEVFNQIWLGLREQDADLFPAESVIRDSALFKASPFHKLTQEQFEAKNEIRQAIDMALAEDRSGQLILVQGEAGAGKTVLVSSLFYELLRDPAEDATEGLDAYMLVNHDEQLTVYQQIAEKLGLWDKRQARVSKPTAFINARDPENKADVILVDEAHLLWTQGKQSYRGKHMLTDLIDRARVVVAVMDAAQVVAGNQYSTPTELEAMQARAEKVIALRNQMRIAGSDATLAWIRSFVDHGRIEPIPQDANYDLQVFTTPHDMHDKIKEQAVSPEHGLSRMLATYDWPYKGHARPDDGGTWNVEIDSFSVPWNRELRDRPKKQGVGAKEAWAEQAHTVDEVGSHFTIQGFDLNYAGVIIGPSVKYRDGRVVFDRSASHNKQVTQKRTLQDGTKADVSEELLRNQLNILLTRGVHGLYLFAVDDELQQALLKAQEEKS